MKSEITKKKFVGNLGEDLAARFLEEKGFEIVTRNYLKKFGEIDIVARKTGVIHFVEVKTVSRKNLMDLVSKIQNGVGSKTGSSEFVQPIISEDGFRAEDNVHSWKLKRLSRAIRVYLEERGIGEDGDWQFDIITVLLDVKNKIARVKMLEDIIL